MLIVHNKVEKKFLFWAGWAHDTLTLMRAGDRSTGPVKAEILHHTN